MKIRGKIKFSFLILLVSIFVFVSFVVYQPGVKIIFKNASKENIKELYVNILGKSYFL
jgi:cbb3-type cytochrome oxidase subunit 3